MYHASSDVLTARKEMWVSDVVFNPAQTKLLNYAASLGLPTLDGLSMLVYQGMAAFEMWTGQPAPEAVMKAALRDALSA